MTRSPFAFTRFSSRRWADGFLASHPDWPCQPEPPLEPAAALAAAQADVDQVRADLAEAAAAGRADDLDALIQEALDAVDRRHALSAQAYAGLSAALGLAYRPAPPVVELLTASVGADVASLVLDLPEPLPWERMTWSLTRAGVTGTDPRGHPAGLE